MTNTVQLQTIENIPEYQSSAAIIIHRSIPPQYSHILYFLSHINP